MDSKKIEEGKVDNDDEFLDGLIPSEETQAKDFMTTEANGNGVIVAVFDTGCDPAADGLQTCPDGSPKIVDIVDATGCCDVSMDKVVDLPEKNENDWIELKGLSGRTLKLDAKLTNPTKKFRLGLKQAYELFSKPLVKRMKSERKRVFDEKHEKLLRQVQNKLVSFERNDNNKDKKKEKEDLEARISCLKDTMKSYQDLGPIYDCVVYHDGKEWLALVDTSETGDLRDKTPMTNYRVRFEHDTCDDISMQTYCVNIYDEGRTLSVVTDAGAHGTHVASIIGAYDKDREELRGIAPGCKIVAVRIGDRRVSGSMETCLGMVRAADAVRRNRCDVVNMSYGEPTVSCSTSNSAVLKEFRDLVEKDNVIFVTSAGNAGPALSTCGAPCEPLSDVVIGVGAYVSKDMMSAQYSLLENIPQTAFTWTSVGPSRNGHLGAAIADVPTWCLKFKQQMNGTSMASPNAAGVVSLILSKLKKDKISYSVPRVVRSIENTAKDIRNVVKPAQGQGLIQAVSAYDHVVENADSVTFGLRFRVSVQGGPRGIYLREPYETTGVITRTAHVNVILPNSEKKSTHLKPEVSGWAVRLCATKKWIKCPGHLHAANHRGFQIRVDTDQLKSDALHCGEILGFDITATSDAGPLFRIPVTVVKPRRCDENNEVVVDHGEIRLCPGKLNRFYMTVPRGATWADLHVEAGDYGWGDDGSKLLILVAQQLVNETAHRDSNSERWLRFNQNSRTVMSVPVRESGTLEVVLGQFWSSLGDASARLRVEFRGVTSTSSRSICVTATSRIRRVDILSSLRDETVSPSATLSHGKTLYKPKTASKVVLPRDRKQIDDEEEDDDSGDKTKEAKMYSLRLSYEVIVANEDKASGVSFGIHPLSDLLYENPFQSQLITVRDANNRVVHHSDAWPNKYKASSLSAGKYNVEVDLRHESESVLEKWKKASLTVTQSLKSKITVPVYKSMSDAILGKAWTGSMKLRKGQSLALFLGMPSDDVITKSVSKNFTSQSAFSLFGRMTYCKRTILSGSCPSSVVLEVTPSCTLTKSAAASSSSSSSSKELNDLIRDAKLSHLRSLSTAALKPVKKEEKKEEKEEEKKKDPKEEYENFLKEMLDSHGTHIPLLSIAMKHREKEKNVKLLLDATNRVIENIDVAKISQYFGVKNQPLKPDDKDKKKATEMKQLRDQLVDALMCRCNAQVQDIDEEKWKKSLEELQRWVDLKSADYLTLLADRAKHNGHYGLELQKLLEIEKISNTKRKLTDKALLERKLACYDALNWGLWLELGRSSKVVRFSK